ncbi:MAG: SpoIIE family protein phosphatase [Undibacterium sp.]|uniref:SpoIIE family protein phosphatase n=1 Tax=Undibacterium sp. TaxID=1914977 RepID=UPI002716D122|nr:SpoIIE family protein phosphatase [Undibacterium sp.]MDO8652219.1 SpoIIE family protein phosphatase [Undibacterium sp.]
MQVALNVGYLTRPYKGESVCGDMGACWNLPHRRVMALMDGLGHGPAAHHAARSAMQCIEDNLYRNCAEIFAACNERLINSRGGVLAIAVIDMDTNMMTLGSIGNIRTILLTPQRDFRLGASRGIVGAGYTWMPPDQMLLAQGDTVVMFSDGVDEIANVRSCLGEKNVTPQMLAEDVLTRWGRDSDDATVLVYRHDVM